MLKHYMQQVFHETWCAKIGGKDAALQAVDDTTPPYQRFYAPFMDNLANKEYDPFLHLAKGAYMGIKKPCPLVVEWCEEVVAAAAEFDQVCYFQNSQSKPMLTAHRARKMLSSHLSKSLPLSIHY